MALDESGLRTDHPEVWAETITEHDKQQLVVQYDRTADPAKLTAFLEILTALENERWTYRILGEDVDRDSYRIVGRAVDFNFEDLYQQSRTMVEERETWAPLLGVADIVFSHPDIRTGEVVIYTSQTEVQQVGMKFGVPIRIVGGSGGLEVQLTRFADAKPYSGGAALVTSKSMLSTNPLILCTMGFTWKKNQTGELMGGTAGHCYYEANVSTWYNGGNMVGTRAFYNNPSDGMLLRSSPTGGFAANMWVGESNSNKPRLKVKATYVSGVDGAVARSGARTGQTTPATTVQTVGATAPHSHVANVIFTPITVTWDQTCASGDSGAPWFSTFASDGQAKAHGQHLGRFRPTAQTERYCAYIPVAAQAAALTATVALSP